MPLSTKQKNAQAQRIADARIDRVYRTRCSGYAISVMKIGQVFTVGMAAINAGADDAELGDKVLEFVKSIAEETP